MTKKPIPKPSFLDGCDYLGFKNGQKMWRSRSADRYFTWDAFHGEIEVFNKQGLHLGVFEALSGALIKPAVRGRKIDVS